MKKVLLVEDNEMNRDMLSRRLARNGFDVVIAENGTQGVEMAFSESPELVLMDMNLPDIDGWEATRQIRKRETERMKERGKEQGKEPRLPIIAVTAHAMSMDFKKAIDAGCDQYEPKPIQLASLLQKMNVLLGGDA
jgi:two-component system cell cycle response regulator DivK